MTDKLEAIRERHECVKDNRMLWPAECDRRDLLRLLDEANAERNKWQSKAHALNTEMLGTSKRIADLEAALTVSRGQWIHSVNAAQCLAALKEIGEFIDRNEKV